MQCVIFLLTCDEQGKIQPRYPGLKVLFVHREPWVQGWGRLYTENYDDENHT